jgi:hypothetical protein
VLADRNGRMSRGRDGRLARVRAALQTQRAAAIACFLGAALFALFAIGVADRDARLGPDAPVADATVVEVFRGRTSTVVVDFTTADGQRIRAETEDWYWDPEPAAGDGGRVRYDAGEPADYVRDVRVGPAPWLITMMGCLSAAFFVAGVLGLRGRLPRWFLDA